MLAMTPASSMPTGLWNRTWAAQYSPGRHMSRHEHVGSEHAIHNLFTGNGKIAKEGIQKQLRFAHKHFGRGLGRQNSDVLQAPSQSGLHTLVSRRLGECNVESITPEKQQALRQMEREKKIPPRKHALQT